MYEGTFLPLSAPVTVTDCTANQNDDCTANTDGKTVCVNNVCSGKYFKFTDKKHQFYFLIHIQMQVQ